MMTLEQIEEIKRTVEMMTENPLRYDIVTDSFIIEKERGRVYLKINLEKVEITEEEFDKLHQPMY